MCQKILAKGRVFDDGSKLTKVHPHFASIKSAANDGCRLCALLQTSFHESDLEGPIFFSLRDDDRQMDLEFSNKYGTVVRSFQLLWKSVTSSTTKAVDNASENTNNAATKITRSITFSSSSLSTVKSWYINRVKNHDKCSRTHPGEKLRGSWNPTQLLDLRESEYHDHVRLVHIHELPAAVPYTALIHCWGNFQHLRLLESNLLEFREGLLLQTFSKTFRDAVTVTYRLGVGFLLIHSLCIVQDSPEDLRAVKYDGELV